MGFELGEDFISTNVEKNSTFHIFLIRIPNENVIITSQKDSSIDPTEPPLDLPLH